MYWLFICIGINTHTSKCPLSNPRASWSGPLQVVLGWYSLGYPHSQHLLTPIMAANICLDHGQGSLAKFLVALLSWTLGWILFHISGASSLSSSQVPAARRPVWVTLQSAMEPGPALAWLLLLSLLADCLKAAQSRDFTVKDIIYLHPSSKTLFSLL